MILPIKDDNPTRHAPILTVAILVANVGVFLYAISLGTTGFEVFALRLGLIPFEITHAADAISPTPIPLYLTFFTAMFIHGGWMHLIGNMLYLWIFGNNIEDVLGRFRFIIFYLVCGTLASMGHIVTDLQSNIPMVGASGAISGILGAYLVLFPFARVKTLIFLGFLITIVRVPAIILLVIWILIQIFSGVIAGDGGVAWFAHIGGFVAGMLLILPFNDIKH